MDSLIPLLILTLGFAYIIYATVVCYPLVRRHLMEWYESSSFYFQGRSVTDVFFAQIFNRIGWEFFILSAAAIFGVFGGWIYVGWFAEGQSERADKVGEAFFQPASGFVKLDEAEASGERVFGRSGSSSRYTGEPGPHPQELEEGREAELKAAFDDELIARSLDLIMKWGEGAFLIFAFDEFDGFYIQAVHQSDGIVLEIMGPLFVALREDDNKRLVDLGFRLGAQNFQKLFAREDAYTGVLRKAIREVADIVVPGANKVTCTFAPG